jgi:hypothetical protein
MSVDKQTEDIIKTLNSNPNLDLSVLSNKSPDKKIVNFQPHS